jgi:predicted Rdx family selenoprotein
LAAIIRSAFGHDAEVVAGGRGVFNVMAANELVYSKHTEGRFPTDAEIVQKLRAISKKGAESTRPG